MGETLKFPTTTEEVQALLKRIGVDGVRYFDYEAYGRKVREDDKGCFVNDGYLIRSGVAFEERYHGPEDIPPEHRVFEFPKLNIRERLAAYTEVSRKTDGQHGKPAPEPGREER